MDHQPRPGVRAKKKARDRLIRLAEAHPDWVLGYLDETWWSRLKQPALHAWTAAEPLRLLQREADQADPDPKALACYGLLRGDTDQMLLRFVAGRPVSQVTEDFLAWVCERLRAEGKQALLLIWDNASWHASHAVRHWLRDHNRQVKQLGCGVRIIACSLPSKSPWLNAIEATWVHGQRRVVEADGLLTAHELADRVCDAYGCPHEPHLVIPKKVA